MYTLAILTILLRYLVYLIMDLRYFHNTQSGPGVNKLLQLLIMFLNSLLENSGQLVFDRVGISSRSSKLIWWFWAKLKVRCNICQRSLISMQSCLLNCSAWITSNLYFLIPFIRFQGLWFFNVISWILSLKMIV